MSTNAATQSTRDKRYRTRNTEETARRDAYQLVTDAIVAAIESGTKPWKQSWVNGQGSSFPLRHSGDRYRGINILILWAAAMTKGFCQPFWMTYRQALELKGQVRKGEKGTMVCYYGTAPKRGEGAGQGDEEERYRFLKTFTVFNSQQIDGLPERFYIPAPKVIPLTDRIDEIEALVAATGITIRNGGNRAYYNSAADYVQMPEFTAFQSSELYYATEFHELIHATKARHRLDRDFGCERNGDEGYAREELCAELGAAFLGSELGFEPAHIEDHASYIDHWLTVLKGDKKFIFQAAAKAQAAVDYLLGKSAPATESADGEDA